MTRDRDVVERILRARVYDVAEETPLDPAPGLSARLGAKVWLKREDLQPVFSFKLRGAYNRIAGLAPQDAARGIFAASAGNHAQGVALDVAQQRRSPAARPRSRRAARPAGFPAHRGAGALVNGGEVLAVNALEQVRFRSEVIGDRTQRDTRHL